MKKPRWRQQLRRSLGLRLVLLFLVFALATTAIFVAGMQRALSGGWAGVVRPLVADYVDRLAAELGSPPDAARARALVQRLPVSLRIEGPRVQFDSHPQRRAWHRAAPDEDDGRWLLQRQTADGHRITFGLGVRDWAQRPRTVGWATLAALLLLTALAYATVRHLFRPLDDIRAGAQRFGQGQFDQPIPVRRKDELGELAAQVNTMARDIHAMLEAKRGLLLAVSHELRSPLTRARLNAELVAESEARDALLRDLGTMRVLIGDLLEGERLADGHAALQRAPLDLNALVRGVVGAQFASAGLQIDLAPDLPPLPADAARLRLALRNLIDNALRHSDNALRHGDRGARPRVGTMQRDGSLCLSVRDFGPGVPADALPRLGEAFYRPDASRQRATGGVGLGLHLCRLVAQAHGGTLGIANAETGLRVELSLPLQGPPASQSGHSR